MTKAVIAKIKKVKDEMARLEKIIKELEGNELMADQLYEFKMKYFELCIVLNYLERWDVI